jgi:hypothetical protein
VLTGAVSHRNAGLSRPLAVREIYAEPAALGTPCGRQVLARFPDAEAFRPTRAPVRGLSVPKVPANRRQIDLST